MIGYDVDVRAFDAALRNLAAASEQSTPEVFCTQMRLFAESIDKLTFPRTRAQGARAVERDLRRAVCPLDAKFFQSLKDERLKKRIKDLMRKRDLAALQSVLANVTHGRAQLVPFSPELHSRVRNRRGRVERSTGLYTADVTAWRAYLKKKQAMVGWARGGWNAFGRKVGYNTAAWVAKHGSAGGSASGDPTHPVTPWIEGINRAVGIPGYEQRLRQLALRVRVQAMQRAFVEMLKRRARENGFLP